jgi:hypothetical protein
MLSHPPVHVAIDALRISPKFTSEDWARLDIADAAHWGKAAEMVRDRLQGRFLQFASDCLVRPYSGFVVLSIDSLLAETIQQFRSGVIDGHGNSQTLIKRFLRGRRFQPDFDANARKRFYTDIRCGLLHQAEAKEKWLVRRRQPAMLQKVDGGHGYILDVLRFHDAMRLSLDDYCEELLRPAETVLRDNLWKKMGHICAARAARGAIYEADLAGMDADTDISL